VSKGFTELKVAPPAHR